MFLTDNFFSSRLVATLATMALIVGAIPPSIDWQYLPPWQPIEGHCPGCVAQDRQPRRILPEINHSDLQPGVPQKLTPSGKSTIVKMAIETIQSPSNASVQLVYIPKGRLVSLTNNGFAKMVPSESKEVSKPRLILPIGSLSDKKKRDHNAQNVFRSSSSNAFPMTLIASEGNEATAKEQLQLLEAALSSPKATESKDGQLPRVFIAPSNIPPPPGYVKIPLVPQRQAEDSRNNLPGTFLTHNIPRPLPPGFVRLSLPPSVSHLSKDIPLVKPDTVSEAVSNNFIRDSTAFGNNFFPSSIKQESLQTNQQFINDKREVSSQNFQPNQRFSNEIKSTGFVNLGFDLPQSIRNIESQPSRQQSIPHQPLFLNSFENNKIINPFNPNELPPNAFRAADSAQPGLNPNLRDQFKFDTVIHTPPPRKENLQNTVVNNHFRIPTNNFGIPKHENRHVPNTGTFSQPILSAEDIRPINNNNNNNPRPVSFTSQTFGSQTFRSQERARPDHTIFETGSHANNDNQEFRPLPSSLDHNQIMKLVKNTDELREFEFSTSTPHLSNERGQLPTGVRATTENAFTRQTAPNAGIKIISKGEPKQEKTRSTPLPPLINLSTQNNSPSRVTQFSSFNPVNAFNSGIPVIGTPANIPFPGRSRSPHNAVHASSNENPRFRNNQENQAANFGFNQIITQGNRNTKIIEENTIQPPFQPNNNQLFSLGSQNARFRGQVAMQVDDKRFSQENNRQLQPFENEQISDHFDNTVNPFDDVTFRPPVTPRITTFLPQRETTFASAPRDFQRSSEFPRVTTFPSTTLHREPTFNPFSSFESSTISSQAIEDHNSFDNDFNIPTQNSIQFNQSPTSPRTFSSSSVPFIPTTFTNLPHSFASNSFPSSTLNPFPNGQFSNEANVGPFKVQPFFNSFGVPKQFDEISEGNALTGRPPPSAEHFDVSQRNIIHQSTSQFPTPTQFNPAIQSTALPNFVPGRPIVQFNHFDVPSTTFERGSLGSHGLSNENGFKNNVVRGPEDNFEAIEQQTEKNIPAPHRISGLQVNSFIETNTEVDRVPDISVTTFKPKFNFNRDGVSHGTVESATPIPVDNTSEKTTLFPPFSVAKRRQRLNKKEEKTVTNSSDPTKKSHPFVFGRRIRPRARNQEDNDQTVSSSVTKVRSTTSTTAIPNTIKGRLNISSRIRSRGRTRSTTTTEATNTETAIIDEEFDTTNAPIISEIAEKTTARNQRRGSVVFEQSFNGSELIRPDGLRKRRPGSRKVPQWLRDRRRRLRTQLSTEAPIENENDPPTNFIDDSGFNGAESSIVSVTQPADNTLHHKEVDKSYAPLDLPTEEENIPEGIAEPTSTMDTVKSEDSKLSEVLSAEPDTETTENGSRTFPIDGLVSRSRGDTRYTSSPTRRTSNRAVPPQPREYVNYHPFPLNDHRTDSLLLTPTKQNDETSPLVDLKDRPEQDADLPTNLNSFHIHNDKGTAIKNFKIDSQDFNFDRTIAAPDRHEKQFDDATITDLNSWDRINEHFHDLHTSTEISTVSYVDETNESSSPSSRVTLVDADKKHILNHPFDTIFESNGNVEFVTSGATPTENSAYNSVIKNVKKSHDIFSSAEPDSVGKNYDISNRIKSPQSDYQFGDSMTHFVYAMAPPEILDEHRKNFHAEDIDHISIPEPAPVSANTQEFDTLRTVADGFKRAEETKQSVENSNNGEDFSRNLHGTNTTNSDIGTTAEAQSEGTLVVTSVPLDYTDVTDPPPPETSKDQGNDQKEELNELEPSNVLGHSTILEIRSSEPTVCFPDGRCIIASELKKNTN